HESSEGEAGEGGAKQVEEGETVRSFGSMRHQESNDEAAQKERNDADEINKGQSNEIATRRVQRHGNSERDEYRDDGCQRKKKGEHGELAQQRRLAKPIGPEVGRKPAGGKAKHRQRHDHER